MLKTALPLQRVEVLSLVGELVMARPKKGGGRSKQTFLQRRHTDGQKAHEKMLNITNYWASLVAQIVKNLPAMQETWVQSLGWEDLLKEGMATHSSILAWRIPTNRRAWQATAHGVAMSWTK